ncbi:MULTISPECIES: ATP-binding protein [unclassified Dehalobacter]|jgi:ATPases of the AAA+ class|uniref:AAA family ATPase n=1 Tax=unclassified Dehalobacter TaxID=2635733 RepID=UPI00028BB76C|nr:MULTISPECIES: ATP-binding protein [unclassified Dehalobacter]AFV01209.1 Cell division protein FtsH [Dehalobacter sp. DCA]AFV04248.1 Cell division protein FtsH [Dehalobacter sp. CF]
MATADQIKGLIRAHFDRDDEKFKTTVLQIAAYEAKHGHTNLARELKALLDKANFSKAKVVQINNQNQMLLMSSPDDRLSDLVVSDEVHNRIIRILNEFTNRDKLKKHGLVNRRKILIEGNPGTGKTMTASVIASELRLPLFVVQMDKMVTKFMGETSVKLRQIFDSIESITGVYLFDEFDAIGADRGLDNEVGEMRRILNSFLQFIEQDASDSIIIAATNNHRMLDQALFRRFDDVLHYSLPSSDDVQRLFEIKLGAFSPDFAPSELLVNKALSLSHAEIARVCDDAIKHSILNDVELSQENLMSIISERLSVYSNKEA